MRTAEMTRTDGSAAQVDQVLALVLAELDVAQAEFARFNSGHEGYAVLLEEVDELWEEIHRRPADPRRVCAEAVQVAAMAVRFVLDVGENTARADTLTLLRSELATDLALRPYSSPLQDCAALAEHLERLWRAVKLNQLVQAQLSAVPVAALAARLMLPEGDTPTDAR